MPRHSGRWIDNLLTPRREPRQRVFVQAEQPPQRLHPSGRPNQAVVATARFGGGQHLGPVHVVPATALRLNRAHRRSMSNLPCKCSRVGGVAAPGRLRFVDPSCCGRFDATDRGSSGRGFGRSGGPGLPQVQVDEDWWCVLRGDPNAVSKHGDLAHPHPGMARGRQADKMCISS